MLKTSIDAVALGSILAEPIVVNGVLLCKEGFPITAQLKHSLPKFGITEVTIQQQCSDALLESLSNIKDINTVTLNKLNSLSIDKLVLCARKIVDNLMEDSMSNQMLLALMDYDECTFQHSINVSYFSTLMGIKLRLDADRLYDLALGALLHDIGKLGIPLNILCKPDKLDAEEYRIMQGHPYYGVQALYNIEGISTSVIQIVLQHHENFDGTGYPRQLKGSHSYILARLVHICDVYEALCAKRPYKEPMPRVKARSIILEGSGTSFDPVLVQKFLEYMPMYLPGEIINIGSKSAIVQSCDDLNNPVVLYGNSLYHLNELESVC